MRLQNQDIRWLLVCQSRHFLLNITDPPLNNLSIANHHALYFLHSPAWDGYCQSSCAESSEADHAEEYRLLCHCDASSDGAEAASCCHSILLFIPMYAIFEARKRTYARLTCQ